MDTDYLSKPRRFFAYPSGLGRDVMRLPILLYRMGLGDVLRLYPIFILATRGHRTGRTRHTPLEYRQHGSKFYIISAWGQRANWVQNLLSYPMATVQQGSRRIAVRARLVDNNGEALRALHLFRRSAPATFDSIIARISGEREVNVKRLPDISSNVTILRLDRLPEEPPPLTPVPSDLAWVAPTGALIGLAAVALLVFTRARRS